MGLEKLTKDNATWYALGLAQSGGGNIDVDNFTATMSGTSVILSWQNPTFADFEKIIIVRNQNNYPATPTDGAILYTGTGTTCTDATASTSSPCYYRAFAISKNDKNKAFFNWGQTFLCGVDSSNNLSILVLTNSIYTKNIVPNESSNYYYRLDSNYRNYYYTKNGDVWSGHDHTIYHYNAITKASSNYYGLANNGYAHSLMGICVDAKGNVWSIWSGYNYLQKLNASNNYAIEYYVLPDFSPYASIDGETHAKICIDNANHLILKTFNYVNIFDISGTQPQFLQYVDSTYGYPKLCVDSDNNIWCTTNTTKIIKLDASNNYSIVEYLINYQLLDYTDSNPISADNKGYIWYLPTNGTTVSRVNIETKEVTDYTGFTALTDLCIDKDDNVWACSPTTYTIYKLDASNDYSITSSTTTNGSGTNVAVSRLKSGFEHVL